MKWIHHFSAYKIPFYIYKLNKEDSIICKPSNNSNQSIIILHGIIFLLKIFTSGETLSIAILGKDNTISIQENTFNPTHYYYEAIAIETTYIISFQWNNIIYEDTINPIILINIIKSYQNTVYKYELMGQIITHKYIKNRVIQLLLFLCQEFGIVKNKQITIPFEISQVDISRITGGNKVTINKIMNQLYKQTLIKYYNNKKILITDPLALSYINSQTIRK